MWSKEYLVERTIRNEVRLPDGSYPRTEEEYNAAVLYIGEPEISRRRNELYQLDLGTLGTVFEGGRPENSGTPIGQTPKQEVSLGQVLSNAANNPTSLLAFRLDPLGMTEGGQEAAQVLFSNPQEQQSSAEKAADERLDAQCMLIDLIPELREKNASFRVDSTNVAELENLKTICMTGDTNYFSSYIHGTSSKAKFLDFTTAQLSSLTPILKLYKVIQADNKTTKDYLIPFSTHSAWRSGLSTYGTVEDLLNEERRERPMDVGIKSFSWTFEGTNPVSSRRDISAKLVLFSNNLNNLAELFDIYASDGSKNCFKYLDLLLRSGKKFTADKQYDPQYYTIKIEIGWKTENKELFDEKKGELQCLEDNTTTMLLTLIDHNFDFAQDGTVKVTLDYRAYFEGLLFSDSADIIQSVEQHNQIQEKREKLKTAQIKAEESADPDSASDTKTQQQKEYDLLLKSYSEYIRGITKQSYADIIQGLDNKNQIYVIGINVSSYILFRQQIKSSSDITTQTGVGEIITYSSTESQDIKETAINQATDSVYAKTAEQTGNPDLSNLIPVEEAGYKYLTYFYLGDLLNYIIDKTYEKLDTEPNKPSFIFGSALYRSRSNNARIERVSIMDIPVSVEWFTEWFSNTVISQNKSEYQLLYFLRDLCSKLINNIMSSACDKSGVLKLQNKFNSVDFFIKNDSDGYSFLYKKKKEYMQTSQELSVDDINEVITLHSPLKGEDTSNTTQYIAFYCYDASSPVDVKCDEDQTKGIYHFYFGRDRGLVKNINFAKSQTTGLRELNYVRESSGRGWSQLMTPYDVEMKMVGNNLFKNGMMIFINPSGFGRKIGQPYEVDSISYQLKLGGYHTIYRIESTISTSGFETTIKARWVGSGTTGNLITPGSNLLTSQAKVGTIATGGNATQTNDQAATCNQYDSGFEYPFSISTINNTSYGTRVRTK